MPQLKMERKGSFIVALNAKLPPTAIMTRAQKMAADKYIKERINDGMRLLLPSLKNIAMLAAFDSKLRQPTIQRVMDNYQNLMHEFSDDLYSDLELAEKRISEALKQRHIEWVCEQRKEESHE